MHVGQVQVIVVYHRELVALAELLFNEFQVLRQGGCDPGRVQSIIHSEEGILGGSPSTAAV